MNAEMRPFDARRVSGVAQVGFNTRITQKSAFIPKAKRQAICVGAMKGTFRSPRGATTPP